MSQNEEVQEETLAPPVEETPARSYDDIQGDMLEAMSSNDSDRFDELEQEMISLDATRDAEPVVGDVETNEVVEEVTTGVPTVEAQQETQGPVVNNDAPDKTFAELKAAVVMAERKNAELVAAQAQPAEPSTPVVDEFPSDLVAPTPPVFPDIPSDPSLWNDTDVAKYSAYQTAQTKFNADTVTYMSSIGNVTKTLADGQRQQAMNESKRQQEVAQEKVVQSHWDGVRGLQKSIPSLGTSVDIVEVHKNMDSFGDDLALLHGFHKGTTPAENDAYNRAKQTLIVKYNSGDQNTVAKSSAAGLNKPEGFDTYMRISEVNTFRQQMINSGKLGRQATFEDAYLLKTRDDGTLAESFNDVAVQEREQANVDIANKLKESQGSVRTPSSVAPASAQPTASATADNTSQLTSDEVAMLNEVTKNPSYPFTSPARMQAWGELETKMTQLGYL